MGQQQYDAYLQKLGDVMPELYGAALKRWQAEGEAMSDQLGHATALAQDEYGRKRDKRSMAADIEKKDYDRRWAAYQSLISVIAQSGYQPSDQELADTGMSRELADALLKEFQRTRSSGGGGGGGVFRTGTGGHSSKSTASAASSGSKEAVKLSERSNSEKTRRR